MTKPKPEVEKPPVEMTAEDLKEIAAAILKIEKGMKLLLSSGLNRKAILLLVSSASGGMSQNQVARVIEGLESLGDKFLER